MGREGSPASHQSFGGLMYMHHSSQLYPWAEFSYRCTSKVSCLMLSIDGRITRFRFSWIRDRTGSALKDREVEIKSLSWVLPTPQLAQIPRPKRMNRSNRAKGWAMGRLELRRKLRLRVTCPLGSCSFKRALWSPVWSSSLPCLRGITTVLMPGQGRPATRVWSRRAFLPESTGPSYWQCKPNQGHPAPMICSAAPFCTVCSVSPSGTGWCLLFFLL